MSPNVPSRSKFNCYPFELFFQKSPVYSLAEVRLGFLKAVFSEMSNCPPSPPTPRPPPAHPRTFVRLTIDISWLFLVRRDAIL